MPKLSVIVTMYNEERWLKRCATSVLSQDYDDFELVLVDDGSCDASPAICDELAAKDARVRVIHQANRGFSGARNAGLAAATGDYVMLVDADDYIEPGCLAEAARAIERYDEPDLVIGGLNWTIYDGDETVERTPVAPADDVVFSTAEQDEAWPKLWAISPYAGPLHYCVWGRFYKTSVLRAFDIRFDENLFVQEDVKFAYTFLFYATRCVCSHAIFYNYCRPVGKNDIEEKPQINQYQCVEASLDVVIKTNIKFGFGEPYRTSIIRRTYDHFIKLSEKIFMASTGLSDAERREWVRRLSEGFGFVYFCRELAASDPFWAKLAALKRAGDADGIYDAWTSKLGEGVAPAGE